MYFPPMFQHLIDFSYQRRGIEVAGFFITYMVGTVMAGAIVGSIVAAAFGGNEVRINNNVDLITHSIVMLLITYFIIGKKNLRSKSMLFVFLPLVTSFISLYVGFVFALLIPTFLSTLPVYTSFTPPPTSSNVGANENIVQQQNKSQADTSDEH